MKAKKIAGLFLAGIMTFSSAVASLSYAQEPDHSENSLAVSALDAAVTSTALETEENVNVEDDTDFQLVSNNTWEYSVEIDGIYITKYLGNDENVTIPGQIDGLPVVQVGGRGIVFEGKAVKSVTFPDTVKKIAAQYTGGGAFDDCKTLTTVNLNEGLNVIEYGTFRGCISLTEINIPSTVGSISSDIFEGCTSLTNVTLNSGADIPAGMFRGCYSLQNITFNKSVPTIGYEAFKDCTSLKNISLPDGLTLIGERAFNNSGITSLIVPSTVKTINREAFSNCSSLKSAILNEGLTTLGESAFNGCSVMNTVNIPNTLSEIKDSTFYGCKALKEIKMGNNITAIRNHAFCYCSNLSKLTLNEGLTDIEYSAFRACTSLTNIELPSTLLNITNTTYPNEGAFADCTSLEEIKINDGLTNLGNGTFYNTAIKSITIPSSVKNVGEGLFQDCTHLTEIIINGAITQISWKMFEGCSVLNKINIPDTVTSINKEAFRNCTSLKEIDIHNNIISIGENAFDGCTGLYDIKLHEGLQAIYNDAFSHVPAESIVIPSTVTQIGNEAFWCANIKYAVFMGKQPQNFGKDVFFIDWDHPDDTIIYYADSTGWSEGTYNGYKCYPYPAVNEEISIDDCDRQGFLINISGTDVAYAKGTVNVWSDKNGKDDVEEFIVNIEYDPQKHISYVPEINLDTAKHNDETGLYNVEFCYGTESRKTDVVKSVKVDVPTVSNKIEIELPDVSVTTGGTVRVPVQITNNVGFSTFTFILNYDSSILTAVSAEKGELWGGSMAMNPNFAPGQVSLNGMDIMNNLKTGDLCYVDFKVNDDIQDNMKTEISVEVRELYQYNDKYDSLPVRSLVKNSAVDVQHILTGDVDFDGSVTSFDATQALLHFANVKKLEGTAFEAADYDGDGVVTSFDATQILLKVTGLI